VTPGEARRPLRGEIWELGLDPKLGREQKGIRPCLVVSSDAMNRSSFGIVVICPITTRERPTFAWRPGLEPRDLRVVDASWEPRPSWVMTDQIVTVDVRRRAVRRLATISGERVEEVDRSLSAILDLR